MCAILGVFGNKNISGETIKAAIGHIESHGPDDEGYVSFPSQRTFSGSEIFESASDSEASSSIQETGWMGHRRLKMVEDDSSHQPMERDEVWVVFKGEIYNYESVRDRLREKGYNFETDGDTEVFLQAYREWGLDGLNRLRGMWAAGIRNSDEGKTAIMTDPFSQIPLYYIQGEECWAFSSAIRPLLQLPQVEKESNNDVIADYLLYGAVDHREKTFFKNIRRLPPGTALIHQEEDRKVNYSKIAEEPKDDLLDIIKKSVKMRIPEVGSFSIAVSGGIDSPTVATILKEENPDLFSVTFPGKSFDESQYIEELAQSFDEGIEKLSVSGIDILNEVPENIVGQEEPTSAIQAQIHSILCKKVSQEGDKTLLMGTGPDEYFCGYPWFLTQHIVDLIKSGKFIAAFKKYKHSKDQIPMIYLLSRFLPQRLSQQLEIRSNPANECVYMPENYNKPPELSEPENLEAAVRKRLFSFGLPATLRASNKNGMEESIEVRSPLVDTKILAYAMNEDLSEQLSPPLYKAEYRNTVESLLPEALTERTDKVGYAHSTDEWYSDEGVLDRFEQTFSSSRFQSRPHIDSERILTLLKEDSLPFHLAYRLYVYEYWMREFLD